MPDEAQVATPPGPPPKSIATETPAMLRPVSGTLIIILPLRNPTMVLEQTAKSLAAQHDRRFSILISDNHSTRGREFIDGAISEFQKAGIAVRRVQPPVELGRVEHWNWAHHQAEAEWLKPVFAGDWLDLEFVAKLRAAIAAHPACRYVFSPYVLHRSDTAPLTVTSVWAGKFHEAAEMERHVLSLGMQFGPPSAAAYERTSFVAVGGYPTPLPICADSLLFCALAARFGVLGLAEPLCHFNIHDARFSTNLGEKRKDTFRENITYLFMLAYHAWTRRVAFSKPGFARLLARETRSYLSKK